MTARPDQTAASASAAVQPSAAQDQQPPADLQMLVVGAGPVGSLLALGAAQQGFNVLLLDRQSPRADSRTTALDPAAVAQLQALGLWPQLAPRAMPIRRMQVMGRTAGGTPLGWLSLDGLQVRRSPDARQNPLGWMVENSDLLAVVQPMLTRTDGLTCRFDQQVTGWQPGELTTSSARWRAPLILAADGRDSQLRTWAGIVSERRDYHQKALTVRLALEKPHDGLAFQRFDAGGPIALLPLCDGADGQPRASLVWSDRSEVIDAWLATGDPEALAARVTARLAAPVGRLTLLEPPRAFPLGAAVARRFRAERLALVAEAAHHIHPLAGQGLNLGLRDVAVLVDLLVQQRALGGDLGAADLLARYDSLRRPEVLRLYAVTDGLNALFQAAPPLRGLAEWGMTLVDNSPVKGWLVREMTRTRRP